MTLTEQWKKGELPYGRYYVELAYNGNNIIMAEYWLDKALTLDDHEYSRKEVKRILAKVPSYEEWQKVLNIDFKNEVLRLENKQLKELLKECRKALKKAKGDTVWYPVEIDHTLTQIDNAIGEKK